MEKNTVKNAAKKAVPRTKATKKVMANPQDRYQQIAALAYSLAERNNFFGNQDDYWFAAEKEVDNIN